MLYEPEYTDVMLSNGRARPLLLHTSMVGCVWVIYTLVEDPSLVLIVGGTVMCVTYLVLAIGEIRKAALGLSPLSFYFLWYAVGLGVSAIYEGIVVSGGNSIPFSTALVEPQDLATGYLIYLSGSVALHAGIQRFRPANDNDRARQRPDLRATVASLALMYLAGVVAMFHPSVVAPLGSLGAPFQWMALAALSCFALTSSAELGLSRSAFKGIFVIGTLGLFAGEINSGSKAMMMFSLLPVSWFIFLHRQLWCWLPVVAGMALLVYSAPL